MGLSKVQVKEGFNRAANNYEQFAQLQKTVVERLTADAWSLFDPDDLLLDIGCGTGFVKQILKPANIIQLDLSENMCIKASTLAPAVNADMEQLPMADNSFKGIISSLALQWSTDTEHSFREAFRTLEPGGCFVLSTFGSHTLQELKSIFRSIDPYAHVNKFFEPEDLNGMAKRSGFEYIKIKSEPQMHEYSDVMQLMYTMKNIGATNRQTRRKKGLSSRQYFNQLDTKYREVFGRSGMIPATWEVIYVECRKPQ